MSSIIGLDIGLKSLGMVQHSRGYVKVIGNDCNLGLSIGSDMNEIQEVAEAIALAIPDYSTILVDNTQYSFKSQKGQRENLNTFIGCIAGNTNGCLFFRIEPAEVRKAYGLNHRDSKEDVWCTVSDNLMEQINIQLEGYVGTREHIYDALALIDVWLLCKDTIKVW